MSAAEHPEQLLWFVGGSLDPEETARVSRHLTVCEACRTEATALRSMFHSLRVQERLDHVAASDLVAWEREPGALARTEVRRIERHLAGCVECSSDVDALRRAARRENWTARARPVAHEPPAGTGRARRTRAAIVAAAVVGLAVVAGAWGLGAWRSRPLTGRTSTPIVFAPPRRGEAVERRLEGAGPWTVGVYLPLPAPRGRYDVRIRLADGAADVVFAARVAVGGDEPTTIIVPGGLASGHYLLELTPPAESGEDAYLYGFEVTRSP